ncbi:hypothetical protein BOTNAR_0434g00030 [Botryotinia narcissicola]|uniref:Uncharacterized protein n=1 Tax=Botryotinia narcissicola TaxID=278944 RepID=A0A4Z1HKF9_9HELO|nr:hypothetical protein BOTNAR_0434g00030 [Botryotinia narcissicola]
MQGSIEDVPAEASAATQTQPYGSIFVISKQSVRLGRIDRMFFHNVGFSLTTGRDETWRTRNVFIG